MEDPHALPEYAPLLADYHRAFEDELRAMIASLPAPAGGPMLDVACGDGVYTAWIAEERRASVVFGVDLCRPYLEEARERVGHGTASGRIALAVGSIDRLPFASDTFDLVWCAQSLYSLPKPVEALRRMVEVTRPGGIVAILENDTLHQVLLPWPVEIELAVRFAELRAFVEASARPRKYYIARQLRGVFREAGLDECHSKTWATDRHAPLRPAERSYFQGYLRDLKERAGPYLDPAILGDFERLIDPESDRYLLDRPDLSVTCLDHLVWGIKPRGGPEPQGQRSG